MYVCKCNNLDFRGKVKEDMAKEKKMLDIQETLFIWYI